MKTSLETNLLGAESHGSGGKVRDGRSFTPRRISWAVRDVVRKCDEEQPWLRCPKLYPAPRKQHSNGQTYIVFVEGEMVRGQHSDSQTRAQRRIQEAAENCLILQQW